MKRSWIALALACLALAYFSAFRAYGINLPDEGTLLYKFERMADGQRLYADFHAGYTPGVFFVHSFLQEYLGQSILPGRVMLAIYEFRGPDEYVVVFAPAGKDRPKELDAKKGSGHTMHVWKRAKP